MFLPLVVLINLASGSNLMGMRTGYVPDPAVRMTPQEIFGNCTQRIETLTARRVVLKAQRSLPIWLSLEARHIKASIARERRVCRETLTRTIPVVQNRIDVAKYDINLQKEVRVTTRSFLIERAESVCDMIELLITGKLDTWKFFLDRAERILARWMMLALTDCTADIHEYAKEHRALADDMKAFADISELSVTELLERVPVSAFLTALEPMKKLVTGEWPLNESPKLRAYEARLVEQEHQLASAHEFIAALST
jgi:hypothetical protein